MPRSVQAKVIEQPEQRLDAILDPHDGVAPPVSRHNFREAVLQKHHALRS